MRAVRREIPVLCSGPVGRPVPCINARENGRNPRRLERMGLQTMRRSLHYRQRDNYVHAVDLRTTGQSEWRNGLMPWYLQLVGFRTLRHVGTADHLHVSLPLP